MLSQKQSETEPSTTTDASATVAASSSFIIKDTSVAGGGDDDNPSTSGAVTPSGFINGEGSQEFLSTGRTGRRNAMPDILGQHADTGTADLPQRLEALSTDPMSTRSPMEPGPSQQQHAG